MYYEELYYLYEKHMKIKKPEDNILLKLSLCLHEDDPEKMKTIWHLDREPMIQGLVDFRKHQQGTENWRKNRWKYLRGQKMFHRSTMGKRFHRTLGRYLASRTSEPKTMLGTLRDTMRPQRESVSVEKYSTLTALSSLRTHLYIEREYALPRLEESVEVAYLVEYAVPLLLHIEESLFHDAHYVLTPDEQELLLRLTEQQELLKACAEVWSLPFQIVHKSFVEAYNTLREQHSTDESYFLSRVFEQMLLQRDV